MQIEHWVCSLHPPFCHTLRSATIDVFTSSLSLDRIHRLPYWLEFSYLRATLPPPSPSNIFITKPSHPAFCPIETIGR